VPVLEDCIATVSVGGVEYEAREHNYTANVMKLADEFRVTLPAPYGFVRGVDGIKTPLKDIHAQRGAEVKFTLSDPNVQGGRKIDTMIGVAVGFQMNADPNNGTQLVLTGADLGWKLSTCGPVKKNLRGLVWRDFLDQLIMDPELNLGFRGVRGGNLVSQKIKLGRQVVESDFQQETQGGSIIPPRFQIEVGQTLDSILIQYARLSGYLVNTSADGYFCFFKPASEDGTQKPYTVPASYFFNHHADARRDQNNVMRPTMEVDCSELYTHVECWNTVIDTTDLDTTDPNAGRYHGEFSILGTLPFSRRLTFSDPEQMGETRANARAKWMWQRGMFQAETHSFEAVGHSQDGKPFLEDTIASYSNSVYGAEGLYYVVSVEKSRKLANAGFDRNAGTKTKLTVKPVGFLAA